MGVSRTYLDTYYLLEVVLDGKDKSIIERMLSRINNNSYEVFIPQIVLGEAVSQIFRKCGDKRHPDLLLGKIAMFVRKHDICVGNMPPLLKESFRIMSELTEKDNMLDGTDIAIVSHALADPDSKFLLTPDSMLLNNRTIRDFEENLRRDDERRNTKLIITDQISKSLRV